MSSSKAAIRWSFVRIAMLPYRVVCRARDFYVRSITGCANHQTFGRVGGGQGYNLPRSFSTSSYGSIDAEDLRDLIRANSTNGQAITKAELEMFLRQHLKQLAAVNARPVPRSSSVGMGRIDEEGPCAFGEEPPVKVKGNLVYPRSKSVNVS